MWVERSIAQLLPDNHESLNSLGNIKQLIPYYTIETLTIWF